MILAITELFVVLIALISFPLALRSISLEKQFTDISHIKGELKYRMNVLMILQGLVGFLLTLAFSLFLISEGFSYSVLMVCFIALIVEGAAITTYMITKLKIATNMLAREL